MWWGFRATPPPARPRWPTTTWPKRAVPALPSWPPVKTSWRMPYNWRSTRRFRATILPRPAAPRQAPSRPSPSLKASMRSTRAWNSHPGRGTSTPTTSAASHPHWPGTLAPSYRIPATGRTAGSTPGMAPTWSRSRSMPPPALSPTRRRWPRWAWAPLRMRPRPWPSGPWAIPPPTTLPCWAP